MKKKKGWNYFLLTKCSTAAVYVLEKLSANGSSFSNGFSLSKTVDLAAYSNVPRPPTSKEIQASSLLPVIFSSNSLNF